MSGQSGRGLAEWAAALAGMAIGWALGGTVASGLTAEVTSFWARGQLAGTLLQYGGAAIGAILAYFIARKVLGR
ncbi:hypothetical protein GCM10022226_39320 [Sphaerisporangium flaviroseum]|uniref:GlsB/YeaQ/YmgE family stress response membrane protein n=1 Tax=Sphaerisporangium flaviroseum TaxID=509199 RepID=A0ABP7IBT3_9ACTN